MITWILLLRLDWLLCAAVALGSSAFVFRLDGVRLLFGARVGRQWLWVVGLVLLAGGAAELQSLSVQRERRPAAMADAHTYAFEMALDGHAQIDASTPPDDPRRHAIEATGRAWMNLNPDLVGLRTMRLSADGTWRRVLCIVNSEAGGVVPESSAGDETLWRRAWAGEPAFESSLNHAGGMRVRALQPIRDAAGRVDAVMEAELSGRRWASAILERRLFALGRAYALLVLIGGAIVITRQRYRFREQLQGEQRLRESENRFRSLFDNLPSIAVQGYDRHRRVTFWNHASEGLYGFRREEAMGRRLEELIIPPEMRADVVDGIVRWQETGVPVPAGELVLRRKDGGPVSVFSSHVMQRGADGAMEMYCIDISMTERDRALSALAASERNYRNLFEAVPHPLYVFDLETLAILAANHAASLCYGYSNEELLRMHVVDLPAGDEVETVWKAIRGNSLGGDFGPAESRHRRKDGAILLVEVTAHSLQWAGRRARIVFVQDITARRAAAQRIFEQAALLDKTVEAIVVVDLEQRITYWNRSAAQLFGADAATMVGRRLPELAASAHGVRAAFARVFAETAHDWRGEIPAVDAQGRAVCLDASIALVRDDGGRATARLSVCTDITTRKALEAQTFHTQKMEVLGHLAGGVAHDFNSILMAMTLQVDVLGMDRHCHPTTKAMLGDLKGMTQRAAKLIEQLLLFARKHAMELRPLELNSALVEVVKMVQPLLGPDILLELAPSEPGLWVEADACMIDQVVLNLCVNARDAMPAGGTLSIAVDLVEVTAQDPGLPPQARAGTFARLKVADTGCGMSAEVLAHAFEPFYTTKEAGKGTGLGLSTVHGIVHQHKGWISVESTPGVGTAFRIFLPVSRERGPEAEERAERPLPVGRETVLVVEDDAVVRRLCSVILVRLGYRVLSCADGAEALARWEEHPGAIDVLLSDLILPGKISGHELAALLAERQPALGVVLMSGNNGEILKSDSYSGPGHFFVQKPVDAETLARVIRECLE